VDFGRKHKNVYQESTIDAFRIECINRDKLVEDMQDDQEIDGGKIPLNI
jgi:hypothetical protein